MPVRTVVEEYCDVCFNQDGVETLATDRLRFGWLGRNYVLLVCDAHVGPIRDELQRLSELASPESGAGRRQAAPVARPSRPARTAAPAGRGHTAFSKLDADEKARFRRWADMPNARRISDARVQAWVSAGRP